MRVEIPDLGGEPTTEEVSSFMKQDVLPEGDPSNAEVALVGEAPSWQEMQEMQESKPFVGPAGQILNRVLGLTRLPRYACYILNCMDTQLPGNKTDLLWTEKGFRHPDFYKLQNRLYERLSQFKGSLIMPMGNTALRMLIDHPAFDKIGKYRGSVYRTNDFPYLEKRIPNKFILPTYHPSFALPQSNPVAFHIILNDINKGLTLLNDPSVLDQSVTIHTQQDHATCVDFIHEVAKQPETSFDIEATPEFITCFALTLGPNEAMSIPLMDNRGNYWAPSQEAQIWRKLARPIESQSIEKIAQNGMFDFLFLLRTIGIKVSNFSFDTMIAQHICWTDLPKGLDFLASVYTWLPYYKDEGKLSHLKAIKDWPTYWHYNAMDALATHQCVEPLKRELTKLEGAQEIFDYSMALHKPLFEMSHRGILSDAEGIATKRAELRQEADALQEEINQIVGRPLNPRSSDQLRKYFYIEQNYKPYLDKKTKRPTCNEIALVGLARKGSNVAQKIRELRKKENLISKYFTTVVDDDHRLRCIYNIAGTKYGRLSSEATYMGTGTNLQNQSPIFKQYLLADPDHILIEYDLAKAEAHVVAYLCGDANMIEAFESGVDVHTYNAHKIFNVPMTEVTKHQRKLGKRVVHASNYGMGPKTFSDDLTKDDIFISMPECRELLHAYQRRFPGLKHWHKEIEDKVYRTRILYNLFGRPKRFLGNIDTRLLMSAYSYKPQSTVAGLLNRGLIKVSNDHEFMMRLNGNMILQQLATVHDSGLIQVPISYLGQLPWMLQRINEHLYHKFVYRGMEFVIGLDAKIGYNWGSTMLELKDFSEETVYDGLTQLGITP